MSTESALLAAILANPDEDTPRLAYADWLDENAEALAPRDPKEVRARAEFIRLQIAYEGHSEEPEFDPIWARADAIWREYGKLWMPPLPEGDFFDDRWGFHRGFAEHPRIHIHHFSRLANRLFKIGPVRKLDGTLEPGSLEKLITCRGMRRIRSLDVRGTFYWSHKTTLTQLRRFFRSPHLAGLRELELNWDPASESVFRELVASEPLGRLERLTCGLSTLDAGGAKRLAKSKVLRLRRLAAQQSALGDEGLIALANSPVISQLEFLKLYICQFGGTGVQALAQSPHLGPLRHLDLSGNTIHGAGIAWLAWCPRLAGLRSLNLGFTEPGNDGLSALANSEHLTNLQYLELPANKFKSSAAKIIAAGPAFAQLRSLCLWGNGIGDRGAIELAKATRLTNLERLDLYNCRITEKGAKALIESPNFPRLKWLRTDAKKLSPATLAAFEKRFPRENW